MINLPTFSQNNSLWRDVLLGFNTSTYTIGSHGCLITCLTAIANYYGGKDTPETMNDKMKSVKGFTNGGFYRWGYIEKIYPTINEEWKGRYPNPLTNANLQLIKDSIDAGVPVMCEIDSAPNTAIPDQHFVVFIGYNPKDENDFTIMDAWDGKIKSLKSYLYGTKKSVRHTVLQVVTYRGEFPNDNAEIDNLKQRVAQLTASNKQLEEEKKVLQKKIAESESAYVQKATDYRNNLIKAINNVVY